jgi:hypothetical protein
MTTTKSNIKLPDAEPFPIRGQTIFFLFEAKTTKERFFKSYLTAIYPKNPNAEKIRW